MYKDDRIIPDKTEIVLIDTSGKIPKGINVTHDKIIRISFNPCTETKFFFFEKPSERITIEINGRGPFEFFRLTEGEDRFDRYKDILTEFAKNNRISLINNL